MYRLALLSFHGCPVARLGEKDTGGMNVYVLQLAKQFGRRGCHVDVYTRCHDPRDPQIVELGEGARVIHLKAGPYDNAKDTLYEHIPKFVRKAEGFRRDHGINYDLIHSHYWLSGSVGMVLSGLWGVPHVSTFHTLAKTKLRSRPGERETELRVSVEQEVAESADAAVVSTQQERDDLVRLYGARPETIEVIPAGVDAEMFRPDSRFAARAALDLDGKRVILYVGRMEHLKGLDLLLGAFARLEETADARLLMVGGKLDQDEELDRLKSIAVRLGIGDRVTFTGAVPQTELPTYYRAADVFVLPSYYESFGLAALEAMACGTPVVVSRVGGLKSFVRSGETGYLIPWHCPEPFAERIDMLLANPSLREAMGRAARAKAEQMTWDGVAERMLGFYSSVKEDAWEHAVGA